MGETASPAGAFEAAEIIAAAAADGRRIEIRGGGSKRAYGGGGQGADVVLSTAQLDAVIDYDPQEMILTVGAGARLSDIVALLDRHGQMLGFEPPDYGPLFGEPAGLTTIGGVLAANLSGPRRISAGAARDHLLGFEAVNGRGVLFKAGGKVVKNVTGFDLPKLMAGSWGTLALLTSVTVKVMPKPRAAVTVIVHGLTPEDAVEAMGRAMSLPLTVSGATHRPRETALRLEGFGPSVAARAERLKGELASFGEVEVRDEAFTADYWRDVGRLAFQSGIEGNLWRLSGPPGNGQPGIWAADIFAQHDIELRWQIDWGGALTWMLYPPKFFNGGADNEVSWLAVRGKPTTMIIRETGLAQLECRVRAAFDPASVFVSRAPPLFPAVPAP